MKRHTLARRILTAALPLSLLMLLSWMILAAEGIQNTMIEQKEQDLRVLLARNRDYLRLYAEGLTSGLLGLSDSVSAIGEDEQAILETLQGSKNANPGKLLTVYCMLEDGRVLCTRQPQYEIFGNDFVEACFHTAYESSYRGVRWTEPYFSRLSLARTVALYKPVTVDGQRAMVMQEINLTTMLSSVLRATNDTSLTWSVVSAQGQLVATSDDYTTISSGYKQLSREVLEQSMPAITSMPITAKRCSIDGREYLFSRERGVCMDWSLYTFARASLFYEAVRPTVVRILLTGAIHMVLLSICIAGLSARLTRPITRIAKQIEEADSPLDLKFGSLPERSGEVKVLTDSLTAMIEKMRAMNEEKEETQRQQRLLEIEVLQAQIHPHFMGNTLACIQSLVKENRIDEAESALVALVKLLNYSIARTDEEVSLDDELRCVEAYVKLRQMRRNYSFDYQVYVLKEHGTHRVPRLFLQPIIENCIVHGFSGISYRGVITVTSYEKDGKLFLCVDDNGNGETRERLSDVMNGHLKPSVHSHGIGIGNVFRRLRLIEPEATESCIYPRESKGVRVILDLGYRKEKTT